MNNIHDIIGIGFGPSNLALAVAIAEDHHNSISATFFEKKASFSWHPNMLLNETEMQISFLKDIVTLRNPSSQFTFLNYLHSKGRLNSFANLRKFYPSRIEFNDYYAWVAKQLENTVNYGCTVIDIVPYGNQPHQLLKVIYEYKNAKNQTLQASVLTKNVVVATGGIPAIPQNMKLNANSQRIWHSSSYLAHIAKFKTSNKNPHFCVIGGGQSAAEITYDIYQNFPNANVTCVHRGFGLKPADDSEFVNELFFPDNIDLFFHAPENVRQKILSSHKDTNYSVVDIDLIQKLYQIKYQESVTGNQRLHFKRLTSLETIHDNADHVTVNLKNLVQTSQSESINADAVILATGYTYDYPPSSLKNLSPYFTYNHLNLPKITRHYQMITTPELQTGIYILGYNENTHGLSDTLLSATSIRAKEILDQITLSMHKQDNYFESCDYPYEQNYECYF